MQRSTNHVKSRADCSRCASRLSRPQWGPRWRWSTVVACGLAACLGEGDRAPQEPDQTSTTADGVAARRATDLRSAAPLVGVGRWLGNLAGYRSEEGGACGLGGPDAFLRVEVPITADVSITARGAKFQPRVHAAVYGEWTTEPIMVSPCARGLPLTWSDVPAGTELTVAIGTDPADPALELAGQSLGEAMAFAVDVAFREVWPVGARCDTELRGRCASGSRCVVAPEAAAEALVGLCERVIGDSCTAPIDVRVPRQEGVNFQDLEIGDAHEHRCTGARMVERVYRLTLDETLGPETSLDVIARHPDVGLALRVGDCLADSEIACIAPSDHPPQLRVPVGDKAQLGVPVYVFVEFGASWGRPWEGGRKPYDLRFEVVDG